MLGKWHKESYLPTEEYKADYTPFGSVPKDVFVEYEVAAVEYHGFGTPFIANAVRVTVWVTNSVWAGLTKVYRQAYYGETAEDDARRAGYDHAMKEMYANA
jgi:hypothetical protein